MVLLWVLVRIEYGAWVEWRVKCLDRALLNPGYRRRGDSSPEETCHDTLLVASHDTVKRTPLWTWIAQRFETCLCYRIVAGAVSSWREQLLTQMQT